jgi:hypothetical protein
MRITSDVPLRKRARLDRGLTLYNELVGGMVCYSVLCLWTVLESAWERVWCLRMLLLGLDLLRRSIGLGIASVHGSAFARCDMDYNETFSILQHQNLSA